jgi:hypothetical protein
MKNQHYPPKGKGVREMQKYPNNCNYVFLPETQGEKEGGREGGRERRKDGKEGRQTLYSYYLFLP